MNTTYERDILFSSMIDELEEKEDKEALQNLGRYLYSEYRYAFSELKKVFDGDFDGFIADALIKGPYCKEFIDNYMSDLTSRRKKKASLVVDDYIESINE